ncbi:unnamed protein product [Adineta steineri]|uniref:Uncharacterized protein n=1 Tax=Adineta steineri TaxID=433720 RepID=A0A818PRD6_9BILA|nr:unnamed protein product [Adineta steineri]CAF1019290.1 unnamed protein product [Adineta steineri]CAF1501209.1 unnamed protein product [Adineta steineri]CAF3603277.1 unnamed protein product [Adineta steineri]CAF3610911.1 unnamed protein product [Adineta steineri]
MSIRIGKHLNCIFLATCANSCPSGVTSDLTTTCGRICMTTPPGAFGSASGSVGSTGSCNASSTICPGGTYTITRNTYSSVNFDCASVGCVSYGGCCTGIGNPSSPTAYCFSCH